MSDYISKSALIEQIKLYENELSEDRELGVDSDDEMMLFAIANQETAIYRIKRCIQHEQPTLDETEIIRKVFEKVVERLEEMRDEFDDEWLRTLSASAYQGRETIDMVKQVLKEECGINE